jgi:hypothetical protein
MKLSEFKNQIKENIIEILSEADTAAEKSAVQAQIDAEKAKIKAAQEKIANLQKGVSESKELKEMAKIKGELESAIKNVISNNSSLEGLPLKKAIKNDPAVMSALGDDDLYDNQLNKFIALVKGSRELGKRGRPSMEKPAMEKPVKEPKTSKPTPKNDEEEEIDTYYKADDEFGSNDDDDLASSIEKSLKKVKNTKDEISTKKDEYKALIKQMKDIADKYKASSGEEAKSLVSQLKDLTKEKKRLEAILNPKIDDEDEF